MRLPPGLPLPTAAQTLWWIRRPVHLLELCRRRYGPTFTVRLPGMPLVFLSEPDAIRTVFTAKADEMHAGEVNRILRVLVGSNSVLLLDDAEHLRHRKLLMPSFHGERMRHYGETMVEITRRSMATWSEGAPFSLHRHTQAITMDVILRTVFGLDEGAGLAALREQIRLLLSTSENRAATLLMFYVSTHPDSETRQPWRFWLRHRNSVDTLLYRQIAERRAEPGQDRKDVLAMLLRAEDESGEGMTDTEIRDELVTALAAGHETTATALAWAFERILSHPHVYERLRNEIRSISEDAKPNPERIAALPYLDATIKEVLRLRPIVPIVGRVLKRPFSIGGYELEAGSFVAPCIYLAQRNPDVYPNPDEFRPERFEGVPPDPYSWLPFGGGIRRCIGAAFAVYEMKVVLATILAGADLTLAQTTPARVVRRAVTFAPEHGTRVTFVRRRSATRAATI